MFDFSLLPTHLVCALRGNGIVGAQFFILTADSRLLLLALAQAIGFIDEVLHLLAISGGSGVVGRACQQAIGLYSADVPSAQKETVVAEWRSGCAPVLVATSAFAYGVDVPNVGSVVHVDGSFSLAEYAQAQALTLAVEFLNRFECYFLNTLGDAAALVKAVDNSHFGAMFDSFHANIEEKDPAAAIAAHGEVIRHVHISENDRGTPGSGHVDFEALFKAFKARGYDGWYTIEAFGLALPDLAAAARIWRKCFASEEEVYQKGYTLIKSLV